MGHLEAVSRRAKGYIGSVLAAVVEALKEMDAAKADKGRAVEATIPTSGWQSGSGAYPKHYDIPLPGVTANDRAGVTVAPGGMAAAKACGMCPACETMAGKVRVYAASAPTQAITAECWVEKGKE